ncbi:MAG: sulfatase-like hydrolase/transferase, partial [Candidatus Nealsonbacteria bacterium]|nr:sulfatase-like hydrolase/transferase [Candidatus Nealsonbacteria bacterium]
PAPLPQAGEGSSCSTASKVRRPEVETKPFFLYMAYTIPHGNYEVPSDAPYSDKPWSAKLKNYAAMVTRLDGDVGRIMALLAKLDIDRRTIVFFTSDNGAAFVEPTFNSSGRLRGQKRDMYEGGIRVPMIVRRPGRVKPGSSSDQVWAFWDFLPTCAELAGAELPKDIDGISMLPAILDKPQQSHEFLYWEFFERGFQQAVRHGDFKAIRPALGKPLQLYNLAEDPSESQNVAAEHPEEVARIEAYLKTARSESENWPLPKK